MAAPVVPRLTPSMKMEDLFSVGPCLDDKEGATDYSLMEHLGLPRKWIDMVRAMEARGVAWIGVREYYWTPDDWFPGAPLSNDLLSEVQLASKAVFYGPIDKDLLAEIRRRTGGCFYYLNLADQAKTLSVPLAYLKVMRSIGGKTRRWHWNGRQFDRPEEVALAHAEDKGWHGLNDEGAAVRAIVNLVWRTAQRTSTEGADWPGPCQDLPAAAQAQIARIKAFVEESLDDDWLSGVHDDDLYMASHRSRGLDPVASMVAAWEGLGTDFFKRIVSHSTRFGLSGWPDLTLWGNGVVKLVEVKHNDKLHRNQAYWVRNYVKPLGLDVTILRLLAT
jgi:hypothetical protein